MMPYVKRGAAFRRGMGQVQTCNWFQNLMCGSSAVEQVMGVPCSQCNALVAPHHSGECGRPHGAGWLRSNDRVSEPGEYNWRHRNVPVPA